MICILYVAPALAGETGKVGNKYKWLKGKPTTDRGWWILKDKLRIRTHGIVEH